MATLAEIREKYPQYADVPDEVLAKGLHAKHYSQMPFEEFAAKIGLQAPAAPEVSMADRAKQALGLTPVGIGMQLAPKLVAAYKGDAAEELPQAADLPEFVAMQQRQREASPASANLAQAGREMGAATFGTDEELGAAVAEGMPGVKVEADANGNPVYVMPDGKRAYVNQPGLDSQDVLRTGANIASYLPAVRTARAVAGGSTVLRAGATGALSAGTNAAGQKAAGREEVDGGEVALAGGFGGGGELLAPVIGRIAKAIKTNPARGKARAFEILRRDLGIEQPTNAQVETMARGLDEIEAGANPAAVLAADEFGFIYTKGRRLAEGQPGKFQTMTDEEILRQDSGFAGDYMRRIDDSNRQALETALGRQVDLLGGSTPPKNPVEAFERIGERSRTYADDLMGRVDDAYRVAADTGASVPGSSVRGLPRRIDDLLRGVNIDPDVTPATAATIRGLRERVAKLTDGGMLRARRDASGRLMPAPRAPAKDVSLADIDAQRKFINSSFSPSMSKADKMALTRLKGEYDQWMDDAFTNALASGDESAIAALRNGQSLRAEFGRRFEGTADVDNFVQAMIGGDKTPDELIGVALGASQVSKAGAARFVDRLKLATGNDPEVLGALKAAHLMRLTQGKTGETLGMQAIRSNILAAEQNTPSVLRSLYAPGEWAQIKRLANALDPLIDKGTFARRPGTADQILRTLGRFGSLPFIGKAVEMTQTPVRAWRATDAVRPLARAPVGPAVVPAGAATAGSGVAPPKQ